MFNLILPTVLFLLYKVNKINPIILTVDGVAAADQPRVRGHGEVRHSGGGYWVQTFTHTHTFRQVLHIQTNNS